MRSLRTALAATVSLLALTACSGHPTPTVGSPESQEGLSSSKQEVVEPAGPEPKLLPKKSKGAAPTRLLVRAIGVNSQVVPVGLVGRTFIPPNDPSVMGWWAAGAKPGSHDGSVLIAGHHVHDGPAPLNKLRTLTKGDQIVLKRKQGGSIGYTVVSVKDLDKDALAKQATKLFDQDSKPRLVLLTCSGWDGSAYNSNIVVTATQNVVYR